MKILSYLFIIAVPYFIFSGCNKASVADSRYIQGQIAKADSLIKAFNERDSLPSLSSAEIDTLKKIRSSIDIEKYYDAAHAWMEINKAILDAEDYNMLMPSS